MHKFLYLLFNVFVLLPPVVLAQRYAARGVRPERRALIRAYLLVSLPFVLWDIWAAAAGHWGFNAHYLVGYNLAGIPIEEIMFFVSVPYACLFTYLVIKSYNQNKNSSRVVPVVALGAISLVSAVGMVVYAGRGYTRSAALVSLCTCAFLFRTSQINKRYFWQFQVAVLLLFIAANLLLTALPVITYGAGSYIGFRVATIPIEDFFFNFALLTLFVLVYESSLVNLKHK